MVEVGHGMANRRLHHHDLTLGRIDEAHAQPIDVAKPVRGRSPLGIDPEQKPLGVKPEPEPLEQALGHQRHRSPLVATVVSCTVNPLEIGGPSVDFDIQEAGWLVVDRPVATGLRDRREEVPGRIAAQQGVNIAQVLAEEVVEQAVLGAAVVVAVPPEPVGALGDEDLLPGSGHDGRIMPAGTLLGHQELAGRVHCVPAPIVFRMTDPDCEVVADPASREQPRQGVLRRVPADELAGLHRLDARITRHALVERAQKRHTAVGIVFPAVLAVQNDRDERCRVVPAGVANGVQLAQEICRGVRPGTALVVKADLVRHGMVAENDRQVRFALAQLPGAVQELGMADVAAAIPPDLAPGRAPFARWPSREQGFDSADRARPARRW